MSKWGLTYKGAEIVFPSEWNAIIDALEELDSRSPLVLKGGLQTFTGDGATTTFQISHGVGSTPTIALVAKGGSDLPDIDYHTADDTYIYVTFKSAPSSGVEVPIWWLALKL